MRWACADRTEEKKFKSGDSAVKLWFSGSNKSFAPEYGSFIQFYAWFTVVVIFSIVIVIWLAVKSGDKYTVEDANAIAEEFGGIISESHGPLRF